MRAKTGILTRCEECHRLLAAVRDSMSKVQRAKHAYDQAIARTKPAVASTHRAVLLADLARAREEVTDAQRAFHEHASDRCG